MRTLAAPRAGEVTCTRDHFDADRLILYAATVARTLHNNGFFGFVIVMVVGMCRFSRVFFCYSLRKDGGVEKQCARRSKKERAVAGCHEKSFVRIW